MTEQVLTGHVTALPAYGSTDPVKPYRMGINLHLATGQDVQIIMKNPNKKASVFVGKFDPANPGGGGTLAIGQQITIRVSTNAQGQLECAGSSQIAFGTTVPEAYTPGSYGKKGSYDQSGSMTGGLVHDTAAVLAALLQRGEQIEKILSPQFAGVIFDFFLELSTAKKDLVKARLGTTPEAAPAVQTLPLPQGPVTQQVVPQPMAMSPIGAPQPQPAFQPAPQVQGVMPQQITQQGVGAVSPSLQDMRNQVENLINTTQKAPAAGY